MRKPKITHETESFTILSYGKPKPYDIPLRLKYKDFSIKFYKRKKMNTDNVQLDQREEENSIFYANINRLVITSIIAIFAGFCLYHHERVKILETTVNGVSEVNANMASSIAHIARGKVKEEMQ